MYLGVDLVVEVFERGEDHTGQTGHHAVVHVVHVAFITSFTSQKDKSEVRHNPLQ